MSREEHLAWAKQRALAYVDRGDLPNAVASLLSDLGKHPELEKSLSFAALMGMMELQLAGCDADRIRHWIEGFR